MTQKQNKFNYNYVENNFKHLYNRHVDDFQIGIFWVAFVSAMFLCKYNVKKQMLDFYVWMTSFLPDFWNPNHQIPLGRRISIQTYSALTHSALKSSSKLE